MIKINEIKIDAGLINKVAKWIERNEIQDYSSIKVKEPNKEMLYKYFDNDFIDIVADYELQDESEFLIPLCDQFKMMHLMGEITHIINCIQIISTWPRYNLEFLKDNEQCKVPDDLANLQILYAALKNKKSISSLSFTIEGEERQYNFRDRLPLYLIEQALQTYRKDNEIEFQDDLIEPSSFNSNSQDSEIGNERRINKLENRFIVGLVKSFYDFLVSEGKSSNAGVEVSDRYYFLIALVIQKYWAKQFEKSTESFIIEK
ncbi:MAG: hypothetical protein IPG12_03160 [Saprospiraceae bacterium]|nr:hypothetical protein [Saprospiraceae bacterium]